MRRHSVSAPVDRAARRVRRWTSLSESDAFSELERRARRREDRKRGGR
jgi:hypothetical protein